jgi:hypothetical protein
MYVSIRVPVMRIILVNRRLCVKPQVMKASTKAGSSSSSETVMVTTAAKPKTIATPKALAARRQNLCTGDLCRLPDITPYSITIGSGPDAHKAGLGIV